MEILEFVVGLILILIAADLFTNGVEWLGRLYQLGEGAVGSVLAAVGTALPETVIPVVAIVLAGRQPDPAGANSVGVGAILGAPFMLSTLAMFVTGVAILVYRRRRRNGLSVRLDRRVVVQDVQFFMLAYLIALAAALVPPAFYPLRYVAVVALIGIYALYVRRHFQAEAQEQAENLAPLRIHRVDRAHYRPTATARVRVVLLQVVIAVGLIVAGALVFVDAVEHISAGAHLDPALLALVVAPIATELPEAVNSLIWVRQGKDTLALGNITGAMVFQSCIPTIVAITLAAGAWTISEGNLLSFASAGIAYASVVCVFVPMLRRGSMRATDLLTGGVFYAAYVGLVVARLSGVL